MISEYQGYYLLLKENGFNADFSVNKYCDQTFSFSPYYLSPREMSATINQQVLCVTFIALYACNDIKSF